VDVGVDDITLMTTDMRNILEDHAFRYPSWCVEDLYKLVHQSAMGSEHAMTDEAAVQEWLTRELRLMGPGPEEPLLDPISPDSGILRVHLRPYVRHGFGHKLLLGAFVRTAREFRGAQELIAHHAQIAVSLAGEAHLRIVGETISRFFEEMRAKGFPAVHHSLIYQECYRPAYRVVARQFLHPEILAAARETM
jgi:hypothetical protein